MMLEVSIHCIRCGAAYPSAGVPYRCPECSGLFDYRSLPPFDPAQVDPSQPGIWRYRHTFGLDPEVEPVTLGEGNTPLVWAKVVQREIAFKCEFLNPSGSFKDRGSSLIATTLKSRGVTEAVEDSSGNAGASFAAYAARAGIKVRIFVPEAASGPKRWQIEAYGAELVPVPGPRSEAAAAVRRSADAGGVYASHAFLPFNLPGYATTSYEIYEQLGERMPGAVLVPAGQGGLLLGLNRGFDNLRVTTKKGLLSSGERVRDDSFAPKLIGVQASACAPLWAGFFGGQKGPASVEESPTLAEGVKVSQPVRGEAVLAAVRGSGGTFVAVEEQAILPGREALARLGLYVEPTSAIVWSALEQVIDRLPDPVVVMLTGSGYKWLPK